MLTQNFPLVFVDPFMGEVQILGAIIEGSQVWICLESKQKEVLKLTPSQFEKYALEFGCPF